MAQARIETNGVPAIYAALAAVMDGIQNVPKNGKMQFGNTSYEYLRADDVQATLNPLLVANGIVVKSDYDVDTLKRGRGEGVDYVYVNLRLTYIAVADGSSLDVSAVGESQASDDKSVNKALTQAIKNVHRATFQFASGELEPDDLKPKAEGAPQEPAQPRALAQANRAKVEAQPDDRAVELRDAIKAKVAEVEEATGVKPDYAKIGARLGKETKAKNWSVDVKVLAATLKAINDGDLE